LPETLANWEAELQALDAASDLDGLRQTVEHTHAACTAQARLISKARATTAPKLAREVSTLLQKLGMAGARFEVALQHLDEPQSWGAENLEFLVAGHAGSTPKPLAKVASGGELSRIALAIAVCAHGRLGEAGAPTLIFDEIDAGIGGSVGDTVGRLMQGLGHDAQVMAVTHLPQVAACANQHFVVSKTVQRGQTLSSLDSVQGPARVAEVARMLSGEGTDAALAHAQEMLEGGRDAHHTKKEPSP
jgi:DNA repair protein RecN (Recombination protein N)